MANQIGPLPIQTIVKFFAICMIVVGIILLGEGAFSLFSSDGSSDSGINDTIPSIDFAKDRQ